MAPVGQRDGISAPMAAMFMPRTLHEFTVIECRPGMHRLAASAREPARATVADQPIKGNLMIRSSAALFVAVTFILFEAGMSGTEAKENAYSVLYSFCSRSGCADGAGPQGNLVIDKKGNLYGTTGNGGNNANGVIFGVRKPGAEKTLYSFPGGTEGSVPIGGLFRDEAGDLYGTTRVRNDF